MNWWMEVGINIIVCGVQTGRCSVAAGAIVIFCEYSGELVVAPPSMGDIMSTADRDTHERCFRVHNHDRRSAGSKFAGQAIIYST